MLADRWLQMTEMREKKGWMFVEGYCGGNERMKSFRKKWDIWRNVRLHLPKIHGKTLVRKPQHMKPAPDFKCYVKSVILFPFFSWLHFDFVTLFTIWHAYGSTCELHMRHSGLIVISYWQVNQFNASLDFKSKNKSTDIRNGLQYLSQTRKFGLKSNAEGHCC